MNSKNNLADLFSAPEDIDLIIPWDVLSETSRRTLKSTLVYAGFEYQTYVDGFNYLLLQQLTLSDLNDARHVGEKRAQVLIGEIKEVYSKLSMIKSYHRLEPDLNLPSNLILENALDTSLKVLAYISVETNVNEYYARISENLLQTDTDFLQSLHDFREPKNQKWFKLSRKLAPEVDLLKIVQSKLDLPYAVAIGLYPSIDLRAKILAGNLGLIGAIKTFDLKELSSFLNYAELIIKDFISNLVFFEKLNYKELEKTLLDGRSNLSWRTEKKENPTLTIDAKADITNVIDFIEMKFRQNPKIDERTLLILKQRMPLFTNSPKTLEAIAQEWNVTRERIRQITNKWSGWKLKEATYIECLETLANSLSDSEDEEEFISKIQDSPKLGKIPLGAGRLKAMCEFFLLPDLVRKIDESIYRWEHADGAKNELQLEIQKLRSPIGLYDLSFLLNKFDLSRQKLEKIILSIYPRTIFRGNLALARTKNLDTMFENSVAKQLLVASDLEVDEIIIGLERTASYRGVPLIGTKDDLRALVIFLAGAKPSYEIISPRMLKRVSLQKIDTWLVEVFSEISGSMLHSTELVSKALQDGINISSLQVYLINSPIIRSHGGSVYSLVGNDVDSENVETYRKAVLASTRETELNFSIHAERIELRIRPSLNVITSGTIFPPSGLKQMVIEYVFDSNCSCGKLLSKQQVKFAPSGFWTGFTAMIKHGLKEHNMDKESEFIFVFNFENNSVALHPSF